MAMAMDAATVIFISIVLPVIVSGVEIEGKDVGRDGLFEVILRDEAVSRINQLAQISDAQGYLERTFLSPASIRAGNLIKSWMHDAGLRTWVDQMGNLHGRIEGRNESAQALLIGSHMDTVVDAGAYDGSLGVISAISAVKALSVTEKLEKLQRPVEVIAFSDEEGVRFQTTFLGSAAMAGILPSSALQISDKSGVTVKDVLKENAFEATHESLIQVMYDSQSVGGYVEVHIEQGPVLESLGSPLGVVRGIAGQTRLRVTVRGSQGHAGTVPMFLRQDPMVAAAELIVLLESLCKHPENFLNYDEQCGGFTKESLAGLVCTVGEISSWPGASNVIPGQESLALLISLLTRLLKRFHIFARFLKNLDVLQVTFTVDLRAMDDTAREAVILEYYNRINQICEQRVVNCSIERKHDAKAVHCDSELSLQLKQAADSVLRRRSDNIQRDLPVLMSGAGHDAMAMSHLTKVAMLFVRCRGGVSHSPLEYVLDDDVWAAGLAIFEFLETTCM